MLPSKSITSLLGNSYGQDPPDSVLIVSGKQQLTKRRFYEHLRDPRPPASTARNYLYILRVSSVVKALFDSS